MINKKIILGSAAAAALMTLPGTLTAAELLVPAAVNDHIPLATAYNNLEGKFLNFQPVEGDFNNVLASEGKEVFQENMSLKQVSNAINGYVELNVDFPVINVQANADVALASATDEFSSTWVYSKVVQGPYKKLKNVAGSSYIKVSAQGQTLTDKNLSYSQKLNQVGTHYVSQINYGASLFIVMKAEYLNKSDRTAVEAAIGVDFTGVAADVEGSYENTELDRSVKITVRAHQFGGNPLGLTIAIPDNIAQCSLSNFLPCQKLFEKALLYAKDTGTNGFHYDVTGSTANNSQLANLDNLNVISYSLTEYNPLHTPGLAGPSGGYTASSQEEDLIDSLEQDLIEQRNFHKRASALLTNLQSYLTSTQQDAVRAIGQASLSNAAALEDLIEYCQQNAYELDCTTYVNANCPVDNGARQCLQRYSAAILDVKTNELERTKQLYANPMKASTTARLVKDLLFGASTSIRPHMSSTPLTHDSNTGKLTADNGIRFDDSWSNEYYNTYSRNFLVKTNKKLTELKLDFSGFNWNVFKVKVYKDDQWVVSQRDTHDDYWHYRDVDQTVVDGAQSVGGFYYYLFEITNGVAPSFRLIANQGSQDFYFYTSDVYEMSNLDGANRDNTPFYFTNHNINISRDVNGNPIGWCANDNSLQDSINDHCLDNGRLYDHDDAVKACEAYSEQHQQIGASGLVWQLPNKNDFDQLVTRLEQIPISTIPGTNRAGLYMKNWTWDYDPNDPTGTQYEMNTVGFNGEAVGYVTYPWAVSNATLQNKGKESWLWTTTEDSSNSSKAHAFGLKYNTADVFDATFDKRDLRAVRCVAAYAL